MDTAALGRTDVEPVVETRLHKDDLFGTIALLGNWATVGSDMSCVAVGVEEAGVVHHMVVSKVVPWHPKDDSQFDTYHSLVHSAALRFVRMSQYSYSRTPFGRFGRWTFPCPCERYYHHHDLISVDVFSYHPRLKPVLVLEHLGG